MFFHYHFLSQRTYFKVKFNAQHQSTTFNFYNFGNLFGDTLCHLDPITRTHHRRLVGGLQLFDHLGDDMVTLGVGEAARDLFEESGDAFALRDETIIGVGDPFAITPTGKIGNQQSIAPAQLRRQRQPLLAGRPMRRPPFAMLRDPPLHLAVARFRRAHPHIDVQIQYIRTQGQKIALANNEVDIGYMIGPFDHSEYHSLTLTTEPLYVVTPRNHPLLLRPVVRPEDLADQDLILGDMREWEEYRWRLNDMFSAEGIALRVTMEASNTLAQLGLVAAGLGVTIYPESLIGFLGRNVEVRQIMDVRFRHRTILVWKRANRSPQVQAFVQHVDFGEPYTPSLRRRVLDAASSADVALVARSGLALGLQPGRLQFPSPELAVDAVAVERTQQRGKVRH